jgi:xylose isomerase
VGAISPEQAEALLYLLKLHGYQGHFGIDVNPERMPVTTALRISMDALRAMNDRVNDLDHAAILKARRSPDEHRGLIEALLVQARAPNPDRLDATKALSQTGDATSS